VCAQHTDTICDDAITESTLLDYIQFQASQHWASDVGVRP
jgi:hypothetical protein